MFDEIGGNYWLEPRQLTEPTHYNLNIKYINEYEHVIYTSSGRSAITLLLKHIKQANKTVLLPLFTCESVILPFMYNNCNIHFYDVNIDLSINSNSFFESIEKFQPGIIFVQSYFGYDTLADIRSEYHWIREKGVVIIEDITHLLYSKVNKVGANYYIASLRKWLAIPDGGVAISPHEKILTGSFNIHDTFVNQTTKAMYLKYEYTKNPESWLKDEFIKLFNASEDLLNLDCSCYALSEISNTILFSTDFKILRTVRQNNYKYLLNHLGANEWLKPVFCGSPDYIVPLFLPVYLSCNRDRIRKYMAEKKIYLPILWPIPAMCNVLLTKISSFIYDHIISIPCDQRYNFSDMDRIIEAIQEYKD